MTQPRYDEYLAVANLTPPTRFGTKCRRFAASVPPHLAACGGRLPAWLPRNDPIGGELLRQARPVAGTALIAVDVDGTLVGADQVCSARNAAALRRAADLGMEVLFVTARPSRTVVPLAEVIGLRAGSAICSLGAVLCDLPSGRVVESSPMAGDVGREIVRRLRGALPEIVFGWDSGETLWYEAGYPATKGSEGVARCGDASTELADPVVHLFARHPAGGQDWLEQAATLTAGLAETAQWTGVLIDFTAKGVTKLGALQRYCAARGIDQTAVIAIGDMPADIPMLQWAGVGVAVGDAHPAVMAAADNVVAPCAQDGVAEALDALIPQH